MLSEVNMNSTCVQRIGNPQQISQPPGSIDLPLNVMYDNKDKFPRKSSKKENQVSKKDGIKSYEKIDINGAHVGRGPQLLWSKKTSW
jgi:hypothetical protein